MLKYENKIKSVLKNIGMEIPKYSGYKYTIFCVNNIMEQLDTCSDKPLITVAYLECAKAFSNPSKSYTKQCIEHAIRTYKECAISRDYEKLYGRGTNQTNTVFFYNIIALIEEYNKETDSVFENLKRIDKDDDLYFLLSNGYATSYDIEKAAKIMGKEINHPNIEKDLIKFAKNAPGVLDIIKSSDMMPEYFLRYNQKYLAIRFCIREFGISIVEAKNLIESVLED